MGRRGASSPPSYLIAMFEIDHVADVHLATGVVQLVGALAVRERAVFAQHKEAPPPSFHLVKIQGFELGFTLTPLQHTFAPCFVIQPCWMAASSMEAGLVK